MFICNLQKEYKMANNECCGGGSCDHKAEFWGWWKKKDRTYTGDEVKDLLERVKVFNAGAIDPYLTNHADKVFMEWAKELDG